MSVGYPCKHCGCFLMDSKRANCTCDRCRKQISKERYLRDKASGKVQKYKEDNKEAISAYNIEYQRTHTNSEKKRQRKLDMCEYKGNKCQHCGKKVTRYSAAAFDFHHVDGQDKEYSPADMVMMRWSKIIKELDKCILLCSNCHRIHHADVQSDIEGWDEF